MGPPATASRRACAAVSVLVVSVWCESERDVSETVLCSCPGLCYICSPRPRSPCCRVTRHASRSPMQCAGGRRNRVGRPVLLHRDAPRLCRGCTCSRRPRKSCCRATITFEICLVSLSSLPQLVRICVSTQSAEQSTKNKNVASNPRLT